ncbi:hypothetical protein ACX8XP_08800 [Calditrichota bacterium LG25]
MEEIKQNLPKKDDHNPANQNASDKKIYITPTGAVIAMIFFFMPWLKCPVWEELNMRPAQI